MTLARPERGAWWLRLMLSSALIAFGAASSFPAGAQSVLAPTRVGRSSYDVPAQPLSRALVAFSNVTGAQLFFDANLVRGKSSPGAHGSLTRSEALGRLLAGSGLVYRISGNTVTIGSPVGGAGSSTRSDGAIALDMIEVQGEGLFGPTDGYIASDSLTATKTDTPLIETPQSVSVVTRKQLDDQNSKTVSEALRYTAGVAAETRTGRYDYPNIRGFGTPGGSEANFVSLMDGLRLPRGVYYIAPSVDPYLLERVELLRGPSSILYGAVNPGGVVNLWSKRPTTERVREIEVQYGTFNRKQLGFDFGGALDREGTLSYRLTGILRDAEAQVDFAKDQRLAIAPALTWRPSADTSLTILTSFQRDPDAGNFNYLPYVGTVVPSSWGRFKRGFTEADPNFDASKRTQYSLGYQFEHRFDETWTVRQNLRFMHADYDYKTVFQNGWIGAAPELARMSLHSVESFSGLALDNQIQAKFTTGPLQHTALFGFDYRYNEADARLGYGAASSLNVLSPTYYQTFVAPVLDNVTGQRLHQYGLYAQNQIKIDRLTFLVGARGDWVEAKTISAVVSAGTVTPVGQSDRATSWRAGMTYQFDNGLAPYVSYSTSFEPVLGTDWFGKPFKPTTGRQVEGGVKFQPAGWRSFVTASLFEITQQNVKTGDPDGAHPFASVQTGEVRSRGFELEGRVNVTDNFSLLGSYSYTDIKNTKDTNFQGKRPYGVPRSLAAIWTNYEITEGSLSGFSAGLGVRYVGPSFGDAANTLRVPSYTLVDAAIRYDLGKLDARLAGAQIALNATNLLDKSYVSSCWHESSCFYGTGRTVTASLKYRW